MLPILRVFAVFETCPVDENNPKIVSFEIWDGSHKLDSCSTETGIGGAIEAIIRRAIFSVIRKNPVGRLVKLPPGSDDLGLRDFGKIEESDAANNKIETLSLSINLNLLDKRTHEHVVVSYLMESKDDDASVTFKSDLDQRLDQQVQIWAEQIGSPGWIERKLELKKGREQGVGLGFGL